MARRNVYGNTVSENGWPMVDEGSCQWSTVPGTDSVVNLEIQQGQPLTIMRAYAADYHAYIEPLRDADSACWTAGNSVATSNHLSGTAMDLNWDSHPFQVADAGYNPAQIATLREILGFYEDTMFWGNDWDSPKDAMHHQMGYNTFGNPHTQDFINRKIRPDGLSLFRRGVIAGPPTPSPAPPPPPPPLSTADQHALDIIAEGQRLGITPRGIQIALATALVESNLTMYANSNDPPSLDLPHEAVGSDHMSSGLFQQQPPWGSLTCRMNAMCSANLFFTVDNGPGVRGLTMIRDGDGNLYDYNDTANSPGFYAQKVQGSAFPERYDQRFPDALDLYQRLAAPPTPGEEGFLMALTADQQQEIYEKVTTIWDSRSPFRHLDEHRRDDTVGFVLNTDANTHAPFVISLAAIGDPGSLALLQEVAAADLTKYPDRQGDATLAQRVLSALANKPTSSPTPLPTPLPGPGPAPAPVPPPVPMPAPAPSPQKITLLTVSGHLADMLTGYPADLARAMDPHTFYWQPVGNWDFSTLPLGPPCDDAFAEIVRLLTQVHTHGPWAIASYSQGAIAGSRAYMAMAPGGALAGRAADFVGGVTWGNPYREQGSYVGHDPGGHGISSTRIVGTGPLWRDYVDPGDLYANVSGPSGDDCAAIYDMVMRVNPMALMGEALKLFTNPAPELIAMVQAIIQGITFAASSPSTAAHVSYQWRECTPGSTYFQSAVNFMKSVGAQVRR